MQNKREICIYNKKYIQNEKNKNIKQSPATPFGGHGSLYDSLRKNWR